MSSFRDFIDKIASYVGPDGFQHACVSAIIVFVLDAFLPLWGAVILALLIGVGKEVADIIRQKRKGQKVADVLPDCLHDLICDAVGIAFSVVFCLIYATLN